jgi:hypothetical protein
MINIRVQCNPVICRRRHTVVLNINLDGKNPMFEMLIF